MLFFVAIVVGFLHHALDMYLPKIVKVGHRVAIYRAIENNHELLWFDRIVYSLVELD